jgi:SAM-dependent methyltransferase
MTTAPPTTIPPVPTAALYDALAPIYDRWQAAGDTTPFSRVVLSKLLPALERFGREPAAVGAAAPASSPRARSFLDLGCGTGDLLLGMGRAHPGWRLVGVDGSAAMLDVARAKPGADRVQWIQGPLVAPVAPEAVLPALPSLDAAGCFYDTLNHLADVAELNAAVRAVSTQLRPGGLFVFDATNELGFERWWRGNRVWRERTSSERSWSIAIETHYDAARRVAQAEVTIDDGGHQTQASLAERCFTDAEIRAALAAAGLDEVLRELWSPFDLDAPGKTWWIGRNRRV